MCFCGVSGSGKTTLFEKIVSREKSKYKFFYDHQGEFSRRFKMDACFDLEGLAEQTGRGGTIVFDPVKLFPGKSPEGFLFFCDFVFSLSGDLPGRKILICDEMQKLAFRDHPQEVITLMDVGRRMQLDTFFICQSPNQLHPLVRNQLTEIYTFRQGDENAIKPLKTVGFDAKAVAALQRGEWLWRNLNTGDSKSGGKAF